MSDFFVIELLEKEANVLFGDTKRVVAVNFVADDK